MPAPTNVSALTATALGTLPASAAQNVNDAGTTYTVWYQYTAVSGDSVIGVWAFGDLVTYKPRINVYDGPAAAPTAYPASMGGISTAGNKPLQMPVTLGTTYFFEIVSSTGNVATAVLALAVERAPNAVAPSGSLFINDDTDDLPAAMLSATDGTVLRFITPFPNGEQGDVLASTGTFLMDDVTNASLVLYSTALVALATVPFARLNTNAIIRTCQTANTFYVGNQGSGATHASVTTVSSAGVLGAKTWTFATAGLTALAASNDQTILYFAGNAGGGGTGAIKRWDLVNDVALSDLVASDGVRTIRDLLVLSDNTIVALYNKTTVTRDAIVKQFNAAGTLAHSYTVHSGISSTAPRMAYAMDDPVSVWVWTHISGGTSRFQNVKLSDGSVLTTFDVSEYESAVFQPTATATPTRFGPSQSCPLLILRAAVVPGGSIVVTKVNTIGGDATSFPFVATGLTPTSFSLADGVSETFADVAVGSGYGISETVPTGWAVSYVVSNGSPIDNISVASLEAVTVTATNRLSPATRTYALRRLRRFALPFADNKYLFLKRLEILAQMGVGLTEGDAADPPVQGSDPQLMVRISKDGGKTWGAEFWLPLGKIGDYGRRAFAHRLGRGRNLVVEVVDSDPVYSALIECFIESEVGTS